LLDRVVLPAVALLLVVGALFLVLASGEARDVVGIAEGKDRARADRNAEATAEVVARQETSIRDWVNEHPTLLEPKGATKLAQAIAERAGPSSGTSLVAWLVIRANGGLAGVGEPTPGRLVAGGIADDLSVFGRTVSARGRADTTGLLRLGKEPVYAVGVPIRGSSEAMRGAAIAVYFVRKSAIGAFIPGTADSEVDSLALVDARGRLLAGRPLKRGDERVVRDVQGTGWKIQLARDPIELSIPLWSYPLFALLLVLLAVAYCAQEITRRRYRRIGDQRMRQVRTLYALASHVLHARTVREQAEYLAHLALELVDVDGARVRIAAERDDAGIVAGTASPGQREYRVAITGPRQPLGELVLYKAGAPVGEDERDVMRTAATLVGAAIHTMDSLHAERDTASELQRLDELRSNLLATVAHELRSPITAVKGVLGLLAMQDDLGNPKNHEYVDVAMERTDRLVALIQDLFDCSLIETGQLDIRPTRQRADELLAASLGAQAATRPSELILSATPNLNITVDPVRFDQMVNNLVTNAMRHGAPPIEVAVRPWIEGAMVIVSDEGPGIPPEDRDRIFSKFWQGSQGHGRLVEGAGIGLSLVQGLVSLHGGHVEIDSTHTDGRGARFTVYFPDVVPDQSEAEEARRAREAQRDADLEPITRIN